MASRRPSYLKMALKPGRRYRARIEAPYPGPVSYTFLPMLGAEPPCCH